MKSHGQQRDKRSLVRATMNYGNKMKISLNNNISSARLEAQSTKELWENVKSEE